MWGELDVRFDDVVSVKFQHLLQAIRCPVSLMDPVLLDIIIYCGLCIDDFVEYYIQVKLLYTWIHNGVVMYVKVYELTFAGPHRSCAVVCACVRFTLSMYRLATNTHTHSHMREIKFWSWFATETVWIE